MAWQRGLPCAFLEMSSTCPVWCTMPPRAPRCSWLKAVAVLRLSVCRENSHGAATPQQLRDASGGIRLHHQTSAISPPLCSGPAAGVRQLTELWRVRAEPAIATDWAPWQIGLVRHRQEMVRKHALLSDADKVCPPLRAGTRTGTATRRGGI